MKHLFGILLAAAAVALSGCETESSDQIAVSISPNNVTMKKGESQTFTASGWQDYTWSFEDDYGVLSNTKGDTTTLTVIKGNTSTNTTLVKALTLKALQSAQATASTPGSNTTHLVSAQAFITIEYTP